MKRKPPYFTGILLSASSLALLLAIFFSQGSAKSTCAAGFVTCESECAEAHFFASATADGGRFFPKCDCAGFFSERTVSVSANTGQQERLEAFTLHISGSSVVGHASLAPRLETIRKALENSDYQAYEHSVNLFRADIERLSDADKQRLIDLMKHYAEK